MSTPRIEKAKKNTAKDIVFCSTPNGTDVPMCKEGAKVEHVIEKGGIWNFDAKMLRVAFEDLLPVFQQMVEKDCGYRPKFVNFEDI